jgi:ribosomal protein S18 acetylase RimI-like enzyme
MKVRFNAMTDRGRTEELVAMMRALYAEDRGATMVDESGFPRTVEVLIAKPCRGRLMLFEEGKLLRGYALLIPYWSNEFGGTLLFVDEIFVAPEARGRGIGRRFFRYLRDERPFGAVALALEVSPSNTRAMRFYASLGFGKRENSVLTLPFDCDK